MLSACWGTNKTISALKNALFTRLIHEGTMIDATQNLIQTFLLYFYSAWCSPAFWRCRFRAPIITKYQISAQNAWVHSLGPQKLQLKLWSHKKLNQPSWSLQLKGLVLLFPDLFPQSRCLWPFFIPAFLLHTSHKTRPWANSTSLS